ncbi:MAG: hypothetical protein A2V67_08850 [Deltaproteobacteria bacterium RBG_13_61_14]|nr:MAG: hypothetical protein A2V67_08850 [Deltaproteobacteria bacterium RBG_13_61_14]
MGAQKILIVDDDPVVLEVVRDALEDIGYEVHTYSSAVGTNAQLFKVKPDLLILDINMPGLLQGNRIAQIIRDQGYFQKLKILFYSSIPEPELRVMAKDHGANDYLTKSQDIRQLQRKVQSLL